MSSADWSQGYVTDIPYTEGFYRELSPSWLNYVAATYGCVPRPLDKEFTYMELACGLGQTTTVLAGAFPKGQFYGVDFNPSHIDTASRYAGQCGIGNIKFLERSFEQLLDDDLPDFDFITLHGVYVWIGADMQEAIRKFIRRKLKPGGIVYVSYNCLPGWTMDAPIRKWLFEFAGLVPGDSLSRTRSAMQTLRQANEMKTGYFQINQNFGAQLDLLLKREPSYVAHEYLNAHWQLPYSVDVADQLADAKLNYVGSATIIENMLELCMHDEAVKFVRNLPTARLRQLAADYFTFRRFRRDIFVRGHAALQPAMASRYLRRLPVGATRWAEDIQEKVKVPRGEIAFNDPAFPILKEVLAKGAQTIGDIDAQVNAKLGRRSDAERALGLLMAADMVMPYAQTYDAPKIPTQIKKVTWRHPVNRTIAEVALTSARARQLVNPISGNGFVIDPLSAGLIAVLDGKGGTTEELTKRVDEKLKSYGIVIQPPQPNPEEGKSKGETGDSKGEDKGDKAGAPPPDKAPQDPLSHIAANIEASLKKGLPLMARMGLIELS